MRLTLRRATFALLACAGCLIFLVTLQQNNADLSELESHLFVDDRPPARADPEENIPLVTARGRIGGARNSHLAGPWSDPGQLWSVGKDVYNDRIVRQMAHVPWSRDGVRPLRPGRPTLKTIYAPGGLGSTPLGRQKFMEQDCPVNTCSLSVDASSAKHADAVLIQNGYDMLEGVKLPGQIWILWLLESPMNVVDLTWLGDKINWTATYRPDSTIVTPYEKFVSFKNFTSLPERPRRNYAQGKTKVAAWFVSNCVSNNGRLEYARALGNFVQVDVYGACGSLKCRRVSSGYCDKMLNQDYKFYLSFENSNCQYYITEKLFWNALFNDIVPVVMGARRADYLAAAPPNSFILAEDFASPRDLAEYLLKLDQDDDLYNDYFRWKGTGSFINTKYWCRLCALLHEDHKPVMWYDDVESWWRGNGTCTKTRWDEPKNFVRDWRKYVTE